MTLELDEVTEEYDESGSGDIDLDHFIECVRVLTKQAEDEVEVKVQLLNIQYNINELSKQYRLPPIRRFQVPGMSGMVCKGYGLERGLASSNRKKPIHTIHTWAWREYIRIDESLSPSW